jgi:small-conductance mechanosensitive channel/CRP-like cAMP-binding protein
MKELFGNLEDVSGYGSGLPWAVVGFLLIAAALFVKLPKDRRRIRASVMLFALSAVGLVIAAALKPVAEAAQHAAGADTTPAIVSAFKWIQGTGLILHSLAVVTLASIIIFDLLLRAVHLEPPGILRDLLLAVAYALSAVFVLKSLEKVDITGLVATSAVVTAVVGFSLQDTLGNIMGGMAMQLERSVEVGDWIQVDGTVGIVREIRWRQTSIETRVGDTVVIPNSFLTKNRVTVLGKQWGPRRRQHLEYIHFNVDFRFAPTDVIAAVESALHAEHLPAVADIPAAHCLLWDFKDSVAQYVVRYWLTDLTDDEKIDSVVRARVFFALRRAHIPMSIPAVAMFQTLETDARRERKQAEELEERLTTMQDVELFQPLVEEERKQLARRLRNAPFAKGEAMCRQGDAAHWLYILVRGDAEVRLAVDGTSKTVATLHRGSFFGEMGLMTGAPRSATVVAITDAFCYRLDKEAFMDILHKRPEIADGISMILARRRVELDAAKEDLTEEALKQRLNKTQGDLLARMRKFFTLDA